MRVGQRLRRLRRQRLHGLQDLARCGRPLEVAAQLARREERTSIATAAEALDAGAALLTGDHPARTEAA